MLLSVCGENVAIEQTLKIEKIVFIFSGVIICTNMWWTVISIPKHDDNFSAVCAD